MTNELKNTTELVKSILEKDPQARSNDDYLYYAVCYKINAAIKDLSASQLLLHRKKYRYPGFETVRRTRQKVQQHYPELAATEKVEEGRLEKEAEYREFAREII